MTKTADWFAQYGAHAHYEERGVNQDLVWVDDTYPPRGLWPANLPAWVAEYYAAVPAHDVTWYVNDSERVSPVPGVLESFRGLNPADDFYYYFDENGSYQYRIKNVHTTFFQDIMPFVQIVMLAVSAGMFAAITASIDAASAVLVAAGEDVITGSVVSSMSSQIGLVGAEQSMCLATDTAWSVSNAAGRIADALVGTTGTLPASVSNAIGRVAIGTAMNGGNVEAAVKGFAINLSGAQFGDIMGTGFDSQTIGTAAAAGARAALMGGDISTAVGIALIPATGNAIYQGATKVDEYSSDANYNMDQTDYGSTYSDPYADPYAGTTITDYTAPIYTDLTGSVTILADGGVQIDTNQGTAQFAIDGSIVQVDNSGNYHYVTQPNGSTTVYDMRWNEVGNIPADGSVPLPVTGVTVSSVTGAIAGITSVAQQVINTIKAFNAVGAPLPSAANAIRTVSGGTITPNKNGTITTKTAAGVTTVSKMPVGHPYVFADGTSVVNNGDGSITTVTQNGGNAVSPIGGTVTGGAGSLVMYVIGAGLLLMALK